MFAYKAMTKAIECDTLSAQRTIEAIADYAKNQRIGLPPALRGQMTNVIVETQALIGLLAEPGISAEKTAEHAALLAEYHKQNSILLEQLQQIS